MGPRTPCRRSSTPSSTRATASPMAPPASAARATAAAPCPYPFALTTAQSWAGRTSWDSTRALWVIAATSISAQAGRDVPCAMATPPSASPLNTSGRSGPSCRPGTA